MIMHVHHKSDLSEGLDEFAHFARIQKVLPGGGGGGATLTTYFFWVFFLVDEGRDEPNTTISGSTSTRQQNTI